jgi:hypothetical protein
VEGGDVGGGLHAPLLHEDLVEGSFAGQLGDGCEGAEGFVEDDLVDGFDGGGSGFGQVEAGDLERVEEQAGAFGVEHACGDALGDEGDGGLDGAAVFERGQVEPPQRARSARRGPRVEGGEGVAEGGLGFGFASGVVVVTKIFLAERFASATVSVGEDVAALEVFGGGVGIGHERGDPPPRLKYVKSG